MKRILLFFGLIFSLNSFAQTYPQANTLVTISEENFGKITPNQSNLYFIWNAQGGSFWRLRPNDRTSAASSTIRIHPQGSRFERLNVTGASNVGSATPGVSSITLSQISDFNTVWPPKFSDIQQRPSVYPSDWLTTANRPEMLTNISTYLNQKAPNTRAITAGTGLTGGGDLSIDRSLSVVPNSTVQKTEIYNAGSIVGTRKATNFTSSGTAALTITDDPSNDRVNINISATGGSGGMAEPSTNGMVVRDGAGTSVARTITGSAGIAITNGTGVSGNPNIAPANDLLALENLATTGFPKRTATDTWSMGAVDLGTSDATGTLAAGRMPALTGDITSSAGGTATTYNSVVPANKGGAGTVSGLMKANGSGTVSQAVAGTDYLAPNGSAAALTNFPTLNQNTTGTASNITGTAAIGNGGTGATTAANARTNLGLVIGTDVAPVASPALTGTPTAPTATAGTNTTQISTTAFVKTAVDTRVLIVADVATLKTTTGVSGQIATTSGYYAPNDGGGNSYYWNASSTATQDNGSIIQVTGVSPGRWISVEQTEVLVKKWGTKGDGSTDDTTPLTAALAYAVSNSKLLIFTEGDYKVSNYIMNATDFDGDENLFIKIVGNVKITASSGMTAVDKCVINYGKETTGNVSITGDALTVNLRSKFRGFFDIKNYGIVGGVYYTTIDGDFHCKLGSLVVKNSFAPTGGDAIAYGISVIGSYKRVTIENVIVDSVFRYNAAWGECKGINVSGTKGDVIINNCKVSNVRATAAYLANADGINVFGEKQNTVIENSFRLGTATITNCVLSDNQGRNIKIQVSEATIQNCKFLRQYVTTIDNGHDVDVQFGNGKILNNTCIYKKNGATSPLGTYFAAFKFQNVLPNAEQYSLARDNVFYTEAVIPYPFFITHGNVLSPDTVKSSVVDIINNHVINTGTFVGTGSVQRGFCEFNADELNKVVDRCEINLRDNSFFASSTSALLSYNAPIYDVEDQLVFRLVGNKNTNTAQTPFLFHNYFGGQIDSIDVYQVWSNSGFSESFHTTWKVNLAKGKIIAPSRIAFDLYYHSYLINKPPTIGTSGNAIISVLGDWSSGKAKVEIYENTGGSNDYLHYTTSANTWKKATLN